MVSSDELRSAVRKSRLSTAEIARLAGVPKETLYSFMKKPSANLRSEAHFAIERVVSTAPKGVREDPATFTPALNIAKEARDLGLDPEAIAAKAVEDAVKRKRIEAWNEENKDAIESWNAHYRKHGLWNEKYRQF